MDDLRSEGLLALEMLTEAAAADGYARGLWESGRNLDEWRATILSRADTWSGINPSYADYPSCVYGLFVLAVTDPAAYSRLVGSVAGDDPTTFDGLCGVYGFLNLISDDHDYTIDPRGDVGARVTFDGPIGVDGVWGASPAGLWEHLQVALVAAKDNSLATIPMR